MKETLAVVTVDDDELRSRETLRRVPAAGKEPAGGAAFTLSLPRAPHAGTD